MIAADRFIIDGDMAWLIIDAWSQGAGAPGLYDRPCAAEVPADATHHRRPTPTEAPMTDAVSNVTPIRRPVPVGAGVPRKPPVSPMHPAARSVAGHRESSLLRQVAAGLVARWGAGYPVTAADAQRVIDALLDDGTTT